MTLAGSEWLRSNRVARRIGSVRIPLGIAAAVLGALWLIGALAAVPAALAFAAIAAAVLESGEDAPTAPAAAVPPERGIASVPGPLLDTVLAGLPQPVIALDAQGEVLAANAPARAVAPALRVREPVSLALRVPEVLDAIRRAIASNLPQLVEFIERVPLDRWYEAIVVPVALPDPSRQTATRLLLVTLDDLTPLRRSKKCVPTLLPAPAMNCARRWPRCRASSTLCRGRPGTMRARASASSVSCRPRRGGWRG
jgi:hypothetical protein